MPSEMIERVAAAIGAVEYGECAPDTTPNNWARAVRLAEEAIAAMREPTKHMLMASGFGRTQRDKWRAMIDEARR